jgi:hypothetical protein
MIDGTDIASSKSYLGECLHLRPMKLDLSESLAKLLIASCFMKTNILLGWTTVTSLHDVGAHSNSYPLPVQRHSDPSDSQVLHPHRPFSTLQPVL